MSIFKTNKFFRVIKHFILALPLMFILGVSLYTIVNPNAKDSYYGDTINEVEYNNVISKDKLLVDDSYRFNLVQPYTEVSYMGTDAYRIYFTNVSNLVTDSSLDLTDLSSIGFGYLTTGAYRVYLFDSNNVQLGYVNSSSNVLTFDFTYLSNNLLSANIFSFAYVIQSVSFNDYSYLSSSFNYAMYQFNEIGFGKFDFVGLFNGIFINDTSNVYCQFINSYINYYLMIECVYFAPWVIHFFIHFAYDLGDRFINFRRDKKEDD